MNRQTKTRAQHIFTLCCLLMAQTISFAHNENASISHQVSDWLLSLNSHSSSNVSTAQFAADDAKRYQFNWLPGIRAGVRLDALDAKQTANLRNILKTILSEAGALKVDAILATEAALAVISKSPEYRNPGKYYTAVFGKPGDQDWALRFEGHHLSVNLSFKGEELVAATPLFTGANPETIPTGPDKGLRALEQEVDLAKALFESLNDTQRGLATASDEWFGGFLSDPGSRRPKQAKPIGISTSKLDEEQSTLLRKLIAAYVKTVNDDFAEEYLNSRVNSEWDKLRFYWRGETASGADYFYRIASDTLLIELETQGGDRHIHTVWRDREQDFGY